MKRINFSKIIMILALPLMLAGLNSCKPDDGPVTRPEIKIKGETGDFGSTAALDFSAEAATKSVTINSNMDWTVRESTVPTWVNSISPKTDKKGEKTIEIKVDANEEGRRSEVIEFYIKDYSSSNVKLTVTQTAPGDPGTDDILFLEDFGTTATGNPTVGDYTGYTKKSPAGLDQSGVTYESNGGSIRTTMPPSSTEFSGAPVLFMNSDVASKPILNFIVKDVDIDGNTQLMVKFGAGVIGTYPAIIEPNPEEIQLYAGWDGEAWAELTYSSAIDEANDWYWVTAEFAVPSGTEKIFIKLVNSIRQARYDDFQVIKGGNGALIDPVGPPATTETTIKALNDRINANQASQPAGNYHVKGIVVTDMSKGNYTGNSLSIMTEGATGAWNGIMLRGSGTNFFGTKEAPLFSPGEEVTVTLSDATLVAYRGAGAQEGDPYANQVGLTSIDAVEKTGRTATPTPVTITYDKINEYQNMLVQIENAQSESAATQIWPTGNTTTAFTINDDATKEFNVFTATGATDIIGQTFLTGNGTIKGVAFVYGGSASARSAAQLVPRSYADVSGLTGNRVGSSAYFEVTPNSAQQVSASAGNVNFTVAASEGVVWTVTSSNASVFQPSVNGGTGSGAVNITYGANESTTDTRSAVITLQTANTSIPEAERKVEVTITQAAKIVAGSNLLLNNSFETLTDGKPASWTGAAADITAWTILTTGAQDGTNALKMQGDGATRKIQQVITNITPGATYVVSFWYKDNTKGTATQGARIFSYWRTSASANITPVEPLFQPNTLEAVTEWTKYEVEVVAPATAAELLFDIRVTNGYQVTYDNCSVSIKQ